MRNLGQIFIGFIGGILAIIIYSVYSGHQGNENLITSSRDNTLGRTVSSRSEAADSINRVFHAGFGEAAESSLQQVVHIQSLLRASQEHDGDFFGDGFWEQRQNRNNLNPDNFQVSSGSGVIISKDGLIVTNNHVIDNAERIMVSLYNGKDYAAEVVGADPSTDVAVIRIKETNLPAATFANSDQARVGDWVIAVGNPFNLASTVTAGIISAKARNIHILSDNSAIESFIQTDAAVNPGNSGGALVNLEGDLIGINTAIATPSGTFAGYAFAVPSNIVKRVTNDLIQYGEVRRGYLGVSVQDINWQMAQQIKVPVTQGVIVAGVVQGGAAQQAGLLMKDIIVGINGQSIRSTAQLQETVASHRPGEVLTLSVLRGSAKRDIKVKLQNVEDIRKRLSISR